MNFLKPSTKLPQNRLVAMAVKRTLLRQSAKAGGSTALACECQHDQSVYNEVKGTISNLPRIEYTHFSAGETILSQAITITETCCVRVVATMMSGAPAYLAAFELEQPLGTIVTQQEDETRVSAVAMYHYATWQVLLPGTYTYHLVNTSGSGKDVYAVQLKIEAVSCTGPPCACQHHADAYNEVKGTTYWPYDQNSYHTPFADAATILSQAITITKPCCILAVGTILSSSGYSIADFELEQPLGTIVVDQEDETDLRDLSLFHYAAWQVLPAGTYTYSLVNRSGSGKDVLAAQLKIISSTCLVGVPPPGVEGNMLPVIGGIALAVADAALVGYYLLKRFGII